MCQIKREEHIESHIDQKITPDIFTHQKSRSCLERLGTLFKKNTIDQDFAKLPVASGRHLPYGRFAVPESNLARF